MSERRAAAVQLDGAEEHNAQWVDVPESHGAPGVEQAAMDAVVQLQAAGWDVARDLQVTPLPTHPVTCVCTQQDSVCSGPCTKKGSVLSEAHVGSRC